MENHERIIEYDPDTDVRTAGPAAEQLPESYDSLSVGGELLDAKQELLSRLGGMQTFTNPLGAPASGDQIGTENILGVGIGLKESGGRYTGDLAVKVFVREKLPASQATVPESVNGCLTDVEVIGEIFAESYARLYPRPVPSGVSVGHGGIAAGTLGCLVILDNDRLCILSNNHVLSNLNAAHIGDIIIQPGMSDGGRLEGDRIGVLERFVPLEFPGPNLVDAAAAWTTFRFVTPEHVTYTGSPTPLAPSLALTVVKNGRTTQATMGVVTAVSVDGAQVNYRPRIAIFNDQIIIRPVGPAPFSLGGDSGSLIVSADKKQPVGLLFAGSTTHTIANPIHTVITQLGIQRFLLKLE